MDAPAPLSRPAHAAAVTRAPGLLARNAFPVVLTALVAVALTLLSPALLVADSWMTLAAGREVVRHGIPHHDHLTVWSLGARWTDQQWLAQVVWYAVDQLGGLRLVGIAGALVVAATFASAMAASRLLGATARSTFLVAFLALFVAPWSWQVRAQALALPLYVWTVWLAADHARRPSRRILTALPLLVVWANVHGSVLLGAAVVTLAASVVAGRARTRRALAGAVGLAAASWLCALATPYGTDIVRYYRLMLVDPPFADLVQEWDRTTPGGLTALFFVLAGVVVVLASWQRRRLHLFDLLVLAVTLAGALQAIRGIVWFSLAAIVLVPNALDGAIRRPDEVKLPRANLALAAVAVGATAVVVGVVAAKPQSWFQHRWPTAAVEAVRAAGADARVLASDRHADWLLWRLPGLRGRLAYDVRFELYPRSRIVALSRFDYQQGRDWQRLADGYDVIVVDEESGGSLTRSLLRDGRTRLAYRDSRVAVLRR
jgi:hypothetical protein